MTYSPLSPPPSAGFGLDVVYHNDKTGQEGVANVGIGPYCDDACGLQTLLLLLDHNPGPVDCDPGLQTRAALTSYGLSRGIPYNPQTTPQGPICAALIADYEMKFGKGSGAGGGGQCPPGQWGVPPLCFGEKTVETPPPNLCPEGSYGQPPYCVSIPGTTGETPPTGSTQCPPGTVGLPPNCYGLPTGIPGLPTTTTPTTTVPPYTTPPLVVEPPPKPGMPAPPKPGLAAWWAARSTAERAVVIGGAAAVGLTLAVVLIPKRPKAAKATPNRRRTRRTRRPVAKHINRRKARS